MEQSENIFEKENKKGQLKDAILSKNLNLSLKFLEDINDYLIGERGTYNMPKEHARDLEDFLNNNDDDFIKIYLGDGGVSRLIIEREDNNIEMRIGEASSDEVKIKWKQL